ncbi:MAG: efflux RND transporter periplasmic adaptor subunit [Endozoicomonas sp. (ex Botrylloides leachii)]|nr:efflux RND transporter periplasmic adaptor subunit [Endozoicomonas sp. (ex Botrylloides leachii)]
MALTTQMAIAERLVVGIDTVSTRIQQKKVTAIGTLAAREDVTLTSQITGVIKQLYIHDAEKVKAGQKLIALDARFQQAKLNNIRAKLIEDQRHLVALKQLFNKKAVSKLNLDTQESVAEQSQAAFQAEKVTLDYYLIRAPFSGMLGINQLSKGEYIEAGKPLVRLVNLDKLYVDFGLPSRYLGKIKVGEKVSVLFDAWPNKQFSGWISAIDPVIGADSHNLKIRVNIDNSKHLLFPGLLADIIVSLPTHHTLVVETNSIFYKGKQAYVYRVTKKNKVVLSPVVAGQPTAHKTVILQGLKVGDKVVSQGVVKVKDGMTVKAMSTGNAEDSNEKLADRGA